MNRPDKKSVARYAITLAALFTLGSSVYPSMSAHATTGTTASSASSSSAQASSTSASSSSATATNASSTADKSNAALKSNDNKDTGTPVSDGTSTPHSEVTPEIAVQKISKYATVRNSSYAYKIWKGLDFKQSTSFAQYKNKTFKATGKATVKGATYYRIATNSGKTIGYINATALKVTSNAQGAATAANKYITITSKSGNIYANFDWKVKSHLSSNYLKTFKVKNVYYHSNGSVYYSLYNSANKWAGYVNSTFTKNSTHGRLGIGISTNKYVTVFSKGYWLYKTLNWSKYVQSKSVYHYTYHVATEYHANDGATYYRLTNKNGTFRGYVNAKATHVGKGKQGAWISYSEKVVLKNGSYPIRSNFNWTKTKKQYSSYKNWTFVVKGKYDHINQSTYYSLYTPKGTWIGYINRDGVKKYVAPKKSTKPLWLRPSEDKPYPNLKKYPNAYFSVSLKKQRVYVKSASGKVLYTMICSSGLYDWTPTGWYKIQAERGTAFSGANYWTSWLNHGQYLFHTVIVNHDRTYNVAAAKKLGTKASHGCIRLPVPDAIWIYKNAPVGMRVHIY